MTFDSKICLASIAAVLSLASMATAASTLEARDLNGDGIADAYYDSSSNLTWLADADYVKTSGYQGVPGFSYTAPLPSGAISWDIANVWASNLNVDGVTGWRLPHIVDQTTSTYVGTHYQVDNYAYQPGSSELENLFTQTLGNANRQLTNTGPFANVQPGYYWTDKPTNDSHHSNAWTFDPFTLQHAPRMNTVDEAFEGIFAWAVHDGSVGVALTSAVPEPGSLAMLLGGAIAITALTRRKMR